MDTSWVCLPLSHDGNSGTVVYPFDGIRQWLWQVLEGGEGEVHLHTGVGAHLSGMGKDIPSFPDPT